MLGERCKASDSQRLRCSKKGITTMPKTKKSAKRKRHPNITKAISDIKKLQKGHKKMALDLEKTKTMLLRTPFS
jgi:hypothetical protein